MCGIAGILSSDQTERTYEKVQEMCQALAHRGPNNQGVTQIGNVVLGHRRLSIIDLSSAAHQPMSVANSRYTISYNGEIYNFGELKSELKDRGVQFQTESDTEVLLQMYVFYGQKCLERLNGMFAFTIWDQEKQELFLARDRFGQKPLFYHHKQSGYFAFASELKGLLANPDVPQKISYVGINHYLSLGYILSPQTMYEDVFQLEAGHCMYVRQRGRELIKHSYWNYADAFRKRTTLNSDEIAEALKEHIKKAVQRRLISDVPVGAFLSGGIDSSTIVAFAKSFQQQLHTFSVGFDQDSYNESADALLVSDFCQTHHHPMLLGDDYTSQMLGQAISVYDQLFADNSLIPMVEVSKLASKEVTVVLSGDGADEIFAGYPTYKADRYYSLAKYAPLPLRKYLARSKPVFGGEKIGKKYKAQQFFYGTLFDYRKAHYAWRLFFRPEERISILGDEYKDLVYDTDPYTIFKKHYEEVNDLSRLHQHLYVDAKTWLADDILVKLDRSSMYSSIEARCPFLDVDLVSFAASIPDYLKLNQGKMKYILKQAVSELLPVSVIHKKKSGFNAPVHKWIDNTGMNEFQSFNYHVFSQKVGRYFN